MISAPRSSVLAGMSYLRKRYSHFIIVLSQCLFCSLCWIIHFFTTTDAHVSTTIATSSINCPSASHVDIVHTPASPVVAASPSQAPFVSTNEVRRSSRTHKPPVWLSDYILKDQGNANYCYPLSQVIWYDQLSLSFSTALSSYSTIIEPTSYQEAVQDPKWIDAIKVEVQALEDNATWSIVPLPLVSMP